MKLSPFFCNLLVCLLLSLPLGATPLLTWKQQLVRQAVVKYQWLEAYNQQNDRQGLSHRNQYVIELDANWVEERPNKVILKDNYLQLASLLKTFNDQRQDKLRFYVVVVSDYQIDVRETVDPATLPDQISKLSEIAAPLQSKDHYQRFKAEIASIPAEIQAALQHNNYQEKAIYFYGQIKLYKLDAKPRYYYYDELSLIEGRLEAKADAIRNKSKEGISKATPAQLKIEKVVANIINAIQVVVDKREEESPQLKCDESTESMIAKTEAVKAAGLANQVKALTYLMDHPSGQQQWKSSYLIVDDPAIINPDNLFAAEVLPDKLELLTQGNSQYQLYVVLKEVNFLLPNAEWEDFTRQAASQSALAKKPNTIILVAPYYRTLCHGVNGLGMTVNNGTGLVMPAAYSSDAALSRLMNGALAAAGNSFESRFNQAYSHVPKKHTAYYYRVLWNNDLVYHGKEEKQAVTGYDHVTELVLLTDQRFDAIKAAHDTYQVVVQTNAYPGGATQSERILDAYEKYQADVATILANPPRFRQVDKLNLVESNIDRETTQEFVEWYVKRRRWGFLVYFSSPEDKLFYGGRNPEKVKDALLLIDCASALASLVGADFVFDSFGAYYALSNDLYGEAALYTVAASLPGFSSGMRRALTDGGAYALKTVQGTYVYRMKGVLATAPVPPFGIKDAFSQFTKSFLSIRAFRRASKYKTQTEFIKALEEGILANEELAKRLNDYPELVDDYNGFYKQEKGTLEAFLTSPHLALLQTHPKLYGQVKGLERELRKTFMADFGNDAALLAKFEEGSDKLVEAWRVFFEAGVDQTIRSNADNLIILEVKLYEFPDVDFSKINRVIANQLEPNIYISSRLGGNIKGKDHLRTLVGDFENVPGISPKKYSNNSLTKQKSPAPADWADPDLDLPDWASETFSISVTPKVLPEGTKIYRVIGDGQNPKGAFWTYDLPAKKEDLYGGTAVRPEWNNAKWYVEYIVGQGGLKVWDGPTASQRVIDDVNDFMLEGGATQIYIPDKIRASFPDLLKKDIIWQ
jgi:hypothetical protein